MALTDALRPLAVELLRLPGRTVPVPGWFPLVVEAAHPRIRPAGGRVRAHVNGCRMDLDLDEYVQRRIYYRAHEVPEARWVRRLLRPGDLVVDVGANVGFFTLLAAAAVGPGGRVHALEPIPANAEVLERNLALNGLRNVAVRRAAAGDHEGEIRLGLDHPDPGERGVSGHYTEGGAREAIAVPVVTLDALLAGGPPARLVKIDVEGAEPRVLAGMARTLGDRPPDALLLEVNPAALARQGFSVPDMLDPLTEAGYRLRGVTVLGRTGGAVRPPADAPALPPAGAAAGRLGMVLRGLRGADRLETVVAVRPGADLP
ncbi:MAG TPA: FkbM family methyltransferase [Miltoncostaeaceae bacterium]|nr:FkbM family methyltransferase [Miltoncostaeaceae bacterium]